MMRKSVKILSALLLFSVAFLSTEAKAAEQTQNTGDQEEQQPTTRPDSVIFKVHDISPVLDDGIVTGCDFTMTLFNRTSINFRSFTVNLAWTDTVDEKFKFSRYMESFLGPEEFSKQKDLIESDAPDQPLQTNISVNAFGANQQISVRAHVNSDRCYLMLSRASYTVSPCEIARNLDTAGSANVSNKECTNLFEVVDTANPEYFGKFKQVSSTEEAIQNEIIEKKELSDIDDVLNKIVENLGLSNKALTNIN